MQTILNPPTPVTLEAELKPFYLLWLSAVVTAQRPVPTSGKVWLEWPTYLQQWQSDPDFQARELVWLLDQSTTIVGNRGAHKCPDPELIEQLFSEQLISSLWILAFWLWVHLTNCRTCCRAACEFPPEWAHCSRQGWTEPPSSLVFVIPNEAKKRMVELWQQDAARIKCTSFSITIT